jgi:GNAT superfamily N-acetyltransferase
VTRVSVIRTYLQLLRPEELRPRPAPPGAEEPRLERPCAVPFYRALYRDVGRDFLWRDRDAWTNQELATWLDRSDVEVWVLRSQERIAGYAELVRHPDASVEVAYFGLMEWARGAGLGGWLLTRSVERAWTMGAARVWLHTCTLDGPAALPNYVARGFRAYHWESYVTDRPDKLV